MSGKKINIELSEDQIFFIWKHLSATKEYLEKQIKIAYDDMHKFGLQLEVNKIDEFVNKFEKIMDEDFQEDNSEEQNKQIAYAEEPQDKLRYQIGQRFYDYNTGITWEIVGVKSYGDDPVYFVDPTEEYRVYLESELGAMRKTK